MNVETKDAIALCRYVAYGLEDAAATALKRMGSAVKSKYIAALKHVGNKDTGPLAPFNAFWYWHGAGNEEPGSRKPGGLLTIRSFWRIHAPARGVAEIDIIPSKQPVLERWQFGGGNRAQVLRDWVASITRSQQFNKFYHAVLVKEKGWPAVHALPAVPDQPERDIVHPLTAAVAPKLPEWFDKALEKILEGKAKLWERKISGASRPGQRRSGQRRESLRIRGDVSNRRSFDYTSNIGRDTSWAREYLNRKFGPWNP